MRSLHQSHTASGTSCTGELVQLSKHDDVFVLGPHRTCRGAQNGPSHGLAEMFQDVLAEMFQVSKS
jgi:hypothetical protein